MADDEHELKRQIEALAGREIDVDLETLKISLWYAAGAYDYSEGSASWRSIIFPGLRCRPTNLLDVSGVIGTGSDGKRTFRLGDFYCLPQYRLLAEPVNLLATPRSEKPVFATTSHSLVDSDDFTRSNVQITIHTWEPGGDPAPNVTVHWRCRVVSEPIIL